MVSSSKQFSLSCIVLALHVLTGSQNAPTPREIPERDPFWTHHRLVCSFSPPLSSWIYFLSLSWPRSIPAIFLWPLHKQRPPPCNFFYLVRCKDGYGCRFGHHCIIIPEHLADFRRTAKRTTRAPVLIFESVSQLI